MVYVLLVKFVIIVGFALLLGYLLDSYYINVVCYNLGVHAWFYLDGWFLVSGCG